MPNNLAFLLGTEEERSWMKKAACTGLDPALFHPEDDDPELELKVYVAKQICEECVVTEDCLNWAVTRREPYGIWGMKTHHERRRLRLRKKK